MTISAPRVAGEIERGENVLSTTSFKLFFLASFESFLILATSRSGLLTDSQYRIFVLFFIDFSTSSILVISTKDDLILNLVAKFSRNA